jgi:hypothetical protein
MLLKSDRLDLHRNVIDAEPRMHHLANFAEDGLRLTIALDNDMR